MTHIVYHKSQKRVQRAAREQVPDTARLNEGCLYLIAGLLPIRHDDIFLPGCPLATLCLHDSESSGEDYYQTHAEYNSHVLSNLSADISECGHLTASFSIPYHLSLIEMHPEYLCVFYLTT